MKTAALCSLKLEVTRTFCYEIVFMIPACISCKTNIVCAIFSMCGFAWHLLWHIFLEHLYTCPCYIWHILKLLNHLCCMEDEIPVVYVTGMRKYNEQSFRILLNICNIGGFSWFVWILQEALLSVLCQVLTGKSFELILAVAAVEGKLRTFVTKLLKFNECSKQIGGEGGKASQTRAMLFDVTFLMLCSIVHTYGPEVSWLSLICFA